MNGVIGVDLDNTIVCYDRVFHEVAAEEWFVPGTVSPNKLSLRHYLRQTYGEAAWTALQGRVYGAAMDRAILFPGGEAFFREARARGQRVVVVSHRTREPVDGPAVDLHASARAWLDRSGLFETPEALSENVFVEETQDAKLDRVRSLGCAVFIDDLQAFLMRPDFPPDVRRILFDPAGEAGETPGLERAASWHAIGNCVLGETNLT